MVGNSRQRFAKVGKDKKWLSRVCKGLARAAVGLSGLPRPAISWQGSTLVGKVVARAGKGLQELEIVGMGRQWLERVGKG
jgi:uncharacterized GH25 family protein